MVTCLFAISTANPSRALNSQLSSNQIDLINYQNQAESELIAQTAGLGGTVKGEYTLTDEQLQLLNDGGLYVDLHTQNFRAGELRGVLNA